MISNRYKMAFTKYQNKEDPQRNITCKNNNNFTKYTQELTLK